MSNDKMQQEIELLLKTVKHQKSLIEDFEKEKILVKQDLEELQEFENQKLTEKNK